MKSSGQICRSSYSGGSEHRAPALLIEIQACGDERKKGKWGVEKGGEGEGEGGSEGIGVVSLK